MGVLKRFVAMPSANAGEQALKENIKRQPVQLLQEGQPRFHALKRTLDPKCSRRSWSRRDPRTSSHGKKIYIYARTEVSGVHLRFPSRG